MDLIRHEQGLRALVGSQEIQHITPDLASWAIDFACVNIVGKRQLKWWNQSHRYRQFSASAGTQLQAVQEGKVLSLAGVLVDGILAVGPEYHVQEDEDIHNEPLLDIVRSARDLVLWYKDSSHARSRCYVSGCSWVTAFFRTMLGDLMMKEFPVRRATASDKALLSSLLASIGQDDLETLHEDAHPALSPCQPVDADTEPHVHGDPLDLYESMCGMAVNHRFFITESGYMGIGPPDTRSGDQVWVFQSGNVPFITRRTQAENVAGGHHDMYLVGDAYVHGIMDGEAMQNNPETQSVWLH